jgi:hypothetical protein
MYTKKLAAVASIFTVIGVMLFVYPSTDSLIQAGQSKSKQDVTPLVNIRQIAVSSNATIAHYFGKNVVEKIMKQSGCVGIRMYYGKHADGKSGFIFVGVDKYGKDLVPTVIAGPTSMCPPVCEE